jgi:hypothetical protein
VSQHCCVFPLCCAGFSSLSASPTHPCSLPAAARCALRRPPPPHPPQVPTAAAHRAIQASTAPRGLAPVPQANAAAGCCHPHPLQHTASATKASTGTGTPLSQGYPCRAAAAQRSNSSSSSSHAARARSSSSHHHRQQGTESRTAATAAAAAQQQQMRRARRVSVHVCWSLHHLRPTG